MRQQLFSLLLLAALSGSAWAQKDKKTDDLKPADPDTGESTVEEMSWSRLSEQNLRVDKWSLCRVRLPSGVAAS